MSEPDAPRLSERDDAIVVAKEIVQHDMMDAPGGGCVPFSATWARLSSVSDGKRAEIAGGARRRG
jgi:hypothetical protein